MEYCYRSILPITYGFTELRVLTNKLSRSRLHCFHNNPDEDYKRIPDKILFESESY